MMKFSLASVSVIILFLHECSCARIPLQVDITKMAHCDDSKRAGNGDKVGEILRQIITNLRLRKNYAHTMTLKISPV